MLGSTLISLVGKSAKQAKQDAESIVRLALEPMADITIHKVDVYVAGDDSRKVSDPRQVKVDITYAPAITTVAEFQIPPPLSVLSLTFPFSNINSAASAF